MMIHVGRLTAGVSQEIHPLRNEIVFPRSVDRMNFISTTVKNVRLFD